MDIEHVAAPFVGAVLVEVMRWYQIRNIKPSAKYRRMMTSPTYWLPVIAFSIVGPIAILIVFGHDRSPAQLVYLGASAPTVIKELLGAATAQQNTMLGSGDPDEPSFRDYFRLGS